MEGSAPANRALVAEPRLLLWTRRAGGRQRGSGACPNRSIQAAEAHIPSSMADRLSRLRSTVALLALFPVASTRAQGAFDPSAWDIHAAEWRVEPYRGRSALLLRDGAAWLKGARFQNGTIEFDIAFSDTGGFPGIAFRAATHSDFELFYLRQELSGPHATQYTPVLHGQWAWQIYAGSAWEGTVHWARSARRCRAARRPHARPARRRGARGTTPA